MNEGKSKTIWILSELFYPEDSATGHNVTHVAEGLAASFHVRALCAQPTYGSRGLKAPINELHNNVQIHRCRATTLNKDVFSRRVINLITISVSIFINALIKIKRGDIAFVVTNPPTLPFAVYLASKLRGAKIILRIEDVYPDALVAAGMARQSSVLVRFFDFLQRRLYVGVDRIVVLGRDMKNLVKGKMKFHTDRIVLITNFADSDQIKPLQRESNPLLQRLGLIDKFVVQYSGNMGRTHDVESLVECARILEKENNLHFLFIGFGAKEPWLRKATKEFGLKNITILPLQPRSDLEISLNACDLAVISFVKGMSGVSVPCRMYNIMSAGKPILAVADKESELSLLIEEEKIGWVTIPEAPNQIADAIREASTNHEIHCQMSTRARALATKKYSLSNVVQQYKSLVEHLFQEN
jgi:colanic acid biosynthesis glycosyl transferase WcaI